MPLIGINSVTREPRKPSVLEQIESGVNVAAKVLGGGLEAYKQLGPAGQAETRLKNAQAKYHEEGGGKDPLTEAVKYDMAKTILDKHALDKRKMERDLAKPDLTVGQIEVDKGFAQDYRDYKLAGGFAATEKNLDQVTEVAKGLDSGKINTGSWKGWLPRLGREAFDDVLADAEDKALQAVGASLRATLGAQFTEKEGSRILGWTFNPRLSPQINADRLRRLETQLRAANAAKKNAAQWYQSHNMSMAGYEGPTAAEAFGSFYQDDNYGLKQQGGGEKSTGPHGPSIIQNGQTFNWNPKTGAYE